MEGKISSASGKEVPVTFSLRTLAPEERRRLAFRALGVCWGLALATAPLPPIHWLTVPGFFFLGIYQAVRKIREPLHFEEFSFPCPECSQAVAVAPQKALSPWNLVCPSCRYTLKLSFPLP